MLQLCTGRCVGARRAVAAVTRSAPRSAHLPAAGLALALVSWSADALADKVAVLPFSSASAGPGAATKADLDAARGATQSAVVKGGHTEPAPSEMLTAEMAVKDGVADTSDEFRAAGRASSSQWTISARVEPLNAVNGTARYRLELQVCQVKTGRVESLARAIDGADPSRASAQIGEMLAILVRPEGIANADIAWTQTAPPLPSATPAQPLPVAVAAPAPAVVAPGGGAPPASSPAPAYGEGHPFAVGLGLGVLGAFVRPSNAQGSATSVFLSGSLGYALDALPGLELRADFAGAVGGPRALLAEAGARYLHVFEPKLRIYAGPELEIGGFFTRGGDRSGRFLMRSSAIGGIGLTDRIGIEASADLAAAFGDAGTLVFAGASARGVVRF